MASALDDVTVLDLSQALAGPCASTMLRERLGLDEDEISRLRWRGDRRRNEVSEVPMQKIRRRLWVRVGLLCVGFALPARTQATAPTSAPSQAAVQAAGPQSAQPLELSVPTRDGIKLSTIAYLPEGRGPWPVVLVRTPYGKLTVANSNKAWTQSGYAFVVQDCRGTGQSGGDYRPFADDERDGYDTVEWIARERWSDGKVGMYGASAMGIAANLAAAANPPHLVAAFVMIARSSIYHQSAFMGGVFRKELNEIWLRRQKAESVLQETFKHSVHDGFYDRQELSKRWPELRIPIYNYGGWYDIFSQGNIDNFVGLQASGGGIAAGRQKLIVGPWTHTRMDEVKYPANSVVNPQAEAARWFDYWLKGQQNGILEEPPVRYYVMGDVDDPKAPGNEWRTALAWPVPARPASYFLRASGGLSESLPPGDESTATYTYDPKNPVPTIGGANLNIKKGPMDQRATGERKDILKFMTPVLTAPIEVSGRVGVELWAESDAPDTDWMAKLVDVYPGGAERLVLDSALRARFREGFDREAFMEKGKVYRFHIDLWSTSIVFNKGHRIAIHVTSSNEPRFDPNPNTGKPLRADDEVRVATNIIHHDRAHPSRVLLPVVAGLALAGPGQGQQDPLLGRWEGTVEGPQGKRPAVLSFEKDAAGGYTGTITGVRGDLPLKQIKMTGDTVTAEAEFQAAQGSLRIKFSFVLHGTDMKGKSETDFGGQTFTASYDLKRAGAAPAAERAAQATPSARPARSSPPQPTQRQSLDYFSGRWSFRWAGRESALTPGGVLEGTLVLKPLPESEFLEGRIEGQSKTGPLGEKLLLGFVESNKSLVLSEERNGIQTLSVGDWTSPIAIRFKVAPFQAGGRRFRLNRTLTVVAAHSFTLTEELSEDGGPFVRLGKAVFSKPLERAEGSARD